MNSAAESRASSHTTSGGADILAMGFGTTVAMWSIGYVCRLPMVMAPSPVLLAMMLICLIAGGVVAGRYGERGWSGGVWVGVLASGLNMLILGSVLGGDRPNHVLPGAMWWVPGSIAVGAILGAVGGAIGRGFKRDIDPAVNWLNLFAWVTLAAGLLLVAAGGMVTSKEAGLAVPDWPNSFRYNMFLYPLARMSGGVYYEHTHRLLGSLVGLTVITMAVFVAATDRRRWLGRFVAVVVLLVVTQGVLGGLRVTGRFTLSDSAGELAPSIRLAMIHGVVGQLVVAALGGLTVLTSRLWSDARAWSSHGSRSTDRSLSVAMVVAILLQLVLGALLRHVYRGLHVHIMLGVLVLMVTGTCAVRAWGLSLIRAVRRTGRALLILVVLQVLLGIATYVAVGAMAFRNPPPPVEVWLATVHQVTGAVVLVTATMLALWHWRGRQPTVSYENGEGQG